jgi:hypothetical protein
MSLMMLKLQGNPIVDKEMTYRKQFVVSLSVLEELDKLPVNAVERLSYQGLLPKVKIQKVLVELSEQVIQIEASRKLDFELKQEMAEEAGIDLKREMFNSLDDFAKMDEFSFMDDMVSGMLARQHETEETNKEISGIRQRKIQKEVDLATTKYGRAMTPASKLSTSSKTAKLE